MIIKRLIYIPYYIVKTNWRLFFKYARFVKNSRGKAYLSIYKDVLFTMVKHNASPLDYFSLRFYDMKEEERACFACTGFIYEYQLQMNPKAHRVVLENKIEFLKRFKDFSGRKWATLPMLKNDPFFAMENASEFAQQLLEVSSNEINSIQYKSVHDPLMSSTKIFFQN